MKRFDTSSSPHGSGPHGSGPHGSSPHGSSPPAHERLGSLGAESLFGAPAKARGEEIRWDKIRRVRREIAAGTYATAAKLEVALARLLERHVAC
jgi:hypothetical protein